MEGEWKAEIKGTWALFKNGQGKSRTHARGDFEADQRGSGESGQNNLDVREILRIRVSAGVPPKVEGVYCDGGREPVASAPRPTSR